MKNIFNYYYNLYPHSIHRVNDNYKCYIDNLEYWLISYSDDENVLKKKYELSNYLISNNVPCHQIIKNKYGHLLTTINNNRYLLLKIFIKNRNIKVEDILFFSSVYINDNYFTSLLKHEWNQMWANKIDYFEYQVSQFGIKYPIIRESINYYIGMAENSISLFSNIINNQEKKFVIAHRRIKNNEALIDLYNPLNFIMDNKTRDISEYIKEKIFFSKYDINIAKQDIAKFQFNNTEYKLLFIRLLFPSYYFDCYEQVLQGNQKEEELLNIIIKNEKYLSFLRELYFWIKQFTLIPDIDWIIKT